MLFMGKQFNAGDLYKSRDETYGNHQCVNKTPQLCNIIFGNSDVISHSVITPVVVVPKLDKNSQYHPDPRQHGH